MAANAGAEHTSPLHGSTMQGKPPVVVGPCRLANCSHPICCYRIAHLNRYTRLHSRAGYVWHAAYGKCKALCNPHVRVTCLRVTYVSSDKECDNTCIDKANTSKTETCCPLICCIEIIRIILCQLFHSPCACRPVVPTVLTMTE